LSQQLPVPELQLLHFAAAQPGNFLPQIVIHRLSPFCMVWGQSLSTLSRRWKATAAEIRFRPSSGGNRECPPRPGNWITDYDGNRRVCSSRRVPASSPTTVEASPGVLWSVPSCLTFAHPTHG